MQSSTSRSGAWRAFSRVGRASATHRGLPRLSQQRATEATEGRDCVFIFEAPLAMWPFTRIHLTPRLKGTGTKGASVKSLG